MKLYYNRAIYQSNNITQSCCVQVPIDALVSSPDD